jgi:hypothetical protein
VPPRFKPTQSTAASTSGTPTIWSICSGVASFQIDVSHPKAAPEQSFDHVADDDAGGAQELATRGTGEADRTGPRDVDDRARPDAGRDRAVVAGWEDVGEQRQVLDLPAPDRGPGISTG